MINDLNKFSHRFHRLFFYRSLSFSDNYLTKYCHRFRRIFLSVAELVEALQQISQITRLPVVESPDQQLLPQITQNVTNILQIHQSSFPIYRN